MRSGYFPDFSIFRKQERNAKEKGKIFQRKFRHSETSFFKFQNFKKSVLDIQALFNH